MVFQSYALFPHLDVRDNVAYGLKVRGTGASERGRRVDEMLALMRGLGITTVYVTHDQAEAMSLGDRIVVMDHGRVAQVGTPAEIYHHPATPFVADFVGIMNRLTGKLSDGGFASAAGVIPWPTAPAGVTEVLFRPEAARLVPAAAAQLTAVVSAVFFLGDRTRLFLDTGSDRPVVVEMTERRAFVRGDTVHLAVDPDSLLALGGPS
jgi:putative spermidine/putrescine transport system ATP-binding protein